MLILIFKQVSEFENNLFIEFGNLKIKLKLRFFKIVF